MIVADRKPIEEIIEEVKDYEKILILGCNECVTVCEAGGKKEVGVLASALRMYFLNQGREVKIDEEKEIELEVREEKIDKFQADITNYLVLLTRRELSDSHAEVIPLLMHCTNDAEKIADHTENIIALTYRLKKTKQELSASGKAEIDELWKLLKDEAENVINSLNKRFPEGVQNALNDEKQINKSFKIIIDMV